MLCETIPSTTAGDEHNEGNCNLGRRDAVPGKQNNQHAGHPVNQDSNSVTVVVLH